MTWPQRPLEDLVADEPRAITDGPFGSSLARRHYTDDGPRVVRLQNIGDCTFVDSEAHISTSHFESLRNHEVLAGDLLVASLGEVLPRACIAPPSLGPAIVKADCIRVRLHADFDPRWVMYALSRPEARQWAERHRHGVGRPRLGLKGIRRLPVPTPPLDEQRQIVEHLEDYLSRLEAGRTGLDSGSRRASAAYRIVLARLTSNGDEADLSEVLQFAEYGTSTKCSSDGSGIPVARIPNLVDGRIDMTDEKRTVDPSIDLSRLMLRSDDVLLVRTNGSRDLIGRTAVVDRDMEVAFASYLIRLRLETSKMLPDYLHLALAAPSGRDSLESIAASSAGQYNLGIKKLHGLVVRVPSLAEQRDAVEAAASLRTAQNRLAAELAKARLRGEQLRRALLAAAFSGKLTGRASDLDRVEELAASTA